MRKPALLALVSVGLVAQTPQPSAEALAFSSQPWRRINSLSGLPSDIRKDLGFIADPWEPADLTCIHHPNTPTRQLVFGGQSGQQFFVHYIQGMGIVSVGMVALYQRDSNGTMRKLQEWDTGVADRLSNLVALAKQGKFHSR
jgi:hypothetical protein